MHSTTPATTPGTTPARRSVRLCAWRSCTRIVARPAAGTRAPVLEPAFWDSVGASFWGARSEARGPRVRCGLSARNNAHSGHSGDRPPDPETLRKDPPRLHHILIQGNLARAAPAGDQHVVALGCDVLAGGSCAGWWDEARLTACGMLRFVMPSMTASALRMRCSVRGRLIYWSIRSVIRSI
jgi:hypothetical protein